VGSASPRRNLRRRSVVFDERLVKATYVDAEPAGWVAVEPRTEYPKLLTSRIPWRGRDEDKDDDGVRAVTCFTVRKGYRGRGLTYALARATIDFARERDARALEAYPMITQPGKEMTWGEVHVGARQVFEEAGSRRSPIPRSAAWSCGSTSTDPGAARRRTSLSSREPLPELARTRSSEKPWRAGRKPPSCPWGDTPYAAPSWTTHFASSAGCTVGCERNGTWEGRHS
jgi:GNAT superfamily N-acetyltransferase